MLTHPINVNVVCDFDGTISLEDVTDGLLDRFAEPSWKHFEAQWLAGDIGSRECMVRQVSLIHANCDELDQYLDTIEIDLSFRSFVEECEALGNVVLRVVSDGIDYAVKRVLANHGLSRLSVVANTLIGLPNRQYRLEFPHSVAGCRSLAGTCKCAFADSLSAKSPRYSPTILIGDGVSDFCVAEHVDFVFAKGRLLEHCRMKSVSHLAFGTFLDIERELARVVGANHGIMRPAHYHVETPHDS